MQFLKILFWALIAFAAALFTFGNWNWVPISLFGNLVAEVNLPILLLVTFLAGFLPTLLYQRAVRWRLRQRLAAAERMAADLRARDVASPAPVPANAPAPHPAPISPVAVSPEVA
ncbi:Protein of unknown function [Sphingomonas sp. OV641]|uniref:DUF1049 domain-containing protein n=1 Tax=Sphingomonas sp. OV641 TaxID=1881068 RepID=UPI0008D5CB64|nr:DUF1049 domain-containing protein [Sphingomonas sp. OV641]SEJ05081.1 Protein of unknown function [Sphingomonas sp. OV641]